MKDTTIKRSNVEEKAHHGMEGGYAPDCVHGIWNVETICSFMLGGELVNFLGLCSGGICIP